MKEADFFACHDAVYLPHLRQASVGIAGAGGLGSNIAVSLTRAGIGRLVIADHDRIETSNLNRQQYYANQIGLPKVIALKDNLSRISPFTEVQIHQVKLDENNIPAIYKEVDLMIEALDSAEMKEMLTLSWVSHFPDKPIIIASGLAGFGKNELLATRRIGNIYVCGDESSKLQEGISPMAPRVAIVANMQANLALELIIRGISDE